MSQRDVVEKFYNILKDAPQEWLVRDIPPSQVILPLTQVGCTKSNGGHQEDQASNLVELPGDIQVHGPGRIQLYHQIYQYYRSIEKFYLHTKTGRVSTHKGINETE